MLTQEDLIAIGNVVDKKLNQRFSEQDEKWNKKLEQQFAEQDEKWDKKLDEKFKKELKPIKSELKKIRKDIRGIRLYPASFFIKEYTCNL